MYNRYIPQPDGSYRRNRVPEPQNRDPKPAPPPRELHPTPIPDPCPSPAPDTCPPPEHKEPPQKYSSRKEAPSRQESSIRSFFQNILPRDLDTGDLLVIVLLLLMAGDCAEDQNTAMLTLAMYLFM